MPATARKHGERNGAWVSAIAVIAKEKPQDFSAGWLMERCGITSKQAFNAIAHARKMGGVERLGWGRYRAVTKQQAA